MNTAPPDHLHDDPDGGLITGAMSDLTIVPERTPNPNAMKFRMNRQVNPGPARSYYAASSARNDPVAARLFELPSVTGVLSLSDFCSVNQDGTADWEDLIPKVEAILRDAYGNQENLSDPPP